MTCCGSGAGNDPFYLTLLFSQWGFLFGDDGTLGGHFGVELDEGLLVFGHVVLVKDGFDGTFGDAGFAVDALIRMDVENLLAFIEALDRANNYAVGVLAAEAGLANNVGHGCRE